MNKIKISCVGMLLFLLIIITLPANAAVYTYDALNRLTSVTYKNGQRIIYTYDRAGNVINVKSVILDVIPPEISISKPAVDAINVSVSSSVYITFNEAVMEGDYFKDISIRNSNDNAMVDCTSIVNGDMLVIDPASELSYSTTYLVCIPSGVVKDTAGNPLSDEFSLSFTTRAAPNYLPPTIISIDPEHGEKNVPVDSFITIVFSEAVQAGENIDDITIKRGEMTVIYIYDIYDNILTIKPGILLEYGSTYQIKIPAGMVKDLDDTPLEKKYNFVFHTVSQ